MLKALRFQPLLALFSGLSLLLGTNACTHAPQSPARAPTIVRSPCANIDWFETGRADGVTGAALTKLATYQERCDQTPFPVKVDQYTTGRETGLIEFCSPAGALEAGKSLKPYEKVCPEHLEGNFLGQFELGRKIRLLENDRSELEARIINLRNLLPPDARPESSVRQQIELLKSRQSQITQEMTELESKAPTAAQTPSAGGSTVN